MDKHQQRIKDLGALVNHFKQHGTKADEYNTRAEYIDELFALLGWDMYNKIEKAPAHLKQVLREDTVYIDGGAKAPDYSFRIDGKRMFFVEAKKPNVNIHDNADYAFQARSYGYSASEIPVVILTDFQEFSVYDANIKPKEGDNAGIARLKYFTCEDYIKPEVFAYLWDTFSLEAVRTGSLNKYAKEIKKGGESFDTEFLKSLSQWRLKLADAIFLKNKDLHEIHVNFAVQKIMNRLIFLRFAEDRGTSGYGALQAIAKKTENRYQALRQLFDEARTVYNSDLFGTDPSNKDKKAEYIAHKKLLDELIVDDKTIKEIIDDLYFPKSPYAFSVIPIELLGTIYERFLGQKIIRGKYNRAEAVDKIEHRKGQGIYYTPAYIVDYIVQNTLGKLLEGKTPEDIKTLAVADPACGSGSFLITVYDNLLRWYLHYYSENKPQDHIKANKIVKRNGEYTLTVSEKQQILLRHVYGVDLDSQAVEVSKLSLMLKLMEGENHAREGKLTFLPNLEGNIQWGNSLIGTDYTKDMQPDLFGMEEQHKIKVFDWEKAFPEIFKRGGFDCIVGNPPYVFARNQMFTDKQKEYYYKKYPICDYQLNTYLMFIGQANNIIHPKGLIGYIVPNNCLTINSFDKFRHFIIDNTQYLHIINSYDKVFTEANVDTCILIYSKETYGEKHVIGELKEGVFDIAKGDFTPQLSKSYMIHTAQLMDAGNPIPDIMDKIGLNSKQLADFTTVKSGLKAYETGKGIPTQTDEMKKKRVYHSDNKKDGTYWQYLQGGDVSRYLLNWTGEWLSYGQWLAAPRQQFHYEIQRILVRQIPNKLPYCIHAVYTDEPYLNDINSMIIFDFQKYDALFILGILNSRAVSFWFAHYFGKLSRGIFPQFKVNELAQFPIPSLDLGDKTQKKQHDDLVSKVQQMLDFHKKLHAAKEIDKLAIRGQIEALDNQIDTLVYKLYGLDKDEIKTIEA